MTWDYQGGTVFYTDEGSGARTVVLLHGWGCDHSIFDSFTGALASGCRVIAIDFPGFGQSPEPPAVWGVEEYTAMLEEMMHSLGVEKPCFVAHSFGGRVALLYASRQPVDRIMLVDAAGVKPHRSLRYYIKVYSYKLAKWFWLRLLRRPSLPGRFAGLGSADYKSASPRMKAVLSKVVNQDLRSVMPSISAPVLLFWGDADTATPIRDAHVMERLIPDTGLVVVPGGTHYSFLEAPALFASVLDNFFKTA